jgi:hypothetical protein
MDSARRRCAAPLVGLLIALLAAVPALAAAPARAAAPASARVIRAWADAICLASSTAQQARSTAVDTALGAYTTDDTATTRQQLATALTAFFVADLQQLGGLVTLVERHHVPAALRAFVADEYFLTATAKPFIAAVDADDLRYVEWFAAQIAAYSEHAGIEAARAGLFVCGDGRGYVLRVRFARAAALPAGTPVTVHAGGRTLADAGEVLASTRSAGASTALIALGTQAQPVRGPATAQLAGTARFPLIELTAGPARGRRLAYDASVAGSSS